MPSCRKRDARPEAAGQLLRRLFLVLLLLLTAWLPVAHADGITVRSASLRLVDDIYQLNTDFDIHFTSVLQDVVHRGVPLHFTVEFDLVQPHRWWFDDRVATVRMHMDLSYLVLTRQYLLSVNGIQSTYNSWADVVRALSSIREWQVVDRGLVKRHHSYIAGVRMALDTAQLPKPLQFNVMTNSDWNMDSNWYRFQVTP